MGSLAGVAVSATGLRIPGPVMDPLTLIGNMAVPAVLLAFGISLRGSTLREPSVSSTTAAPSPCAAASAARSCSP